MEMRLYMRKLLIKSDTIFVNIFIHIARHTVRVSSYLGMVLSCPMLK